MYRLAISDSTNRSIMNSLLLVLGFHINLAELLLFQLGAVLLGFAIHFLIASKKTFLIQTDYIDSTISEEDRSRLRLYEEVEKLQEQCERLQQALTESKTFIQKLEEEIE